jgi:hypothetical protein
MRMKAVYCLLVFLVGCAQVPRQATYPYTFQQQMQAAHHWEVLARKVVEEVASLRGAPGSLIEPVYIRSNDRSAFGQAFRGFLITELTKQRIFVSPFPETCEIAVSPSQHDRVKICWDVQLVWHQADRNKPPLPFQYTLLTALGFGLAEAWNELSTGAAGAVTAFSLGPLLDFGLGLRTGPLPHSEAIITTAITDRGAMLSHKSNIFYINDGDWQHYREAEALVQKSYGVVDR